MDLEEQIQVLIKDAPADGITPQIVEAIAPVLSQLASQLQHREYYILQTLEQGWLLTTLSNRANPELEKNVIYAFPTLKDAADFDSQSASDPQIMALSVPVTHILFQMLAIDNVNSIVFFDTPGNLASGTEVRRGDIQKLVKARLQRVRPAPQSHPSNFPPDIA
ncbi:MAG: hypothetical protein F6J92_01595 [Symploca sp. SIO1A3]|nr:hypothetical protein [Symploca sp. SIO1A3]